MKYNKFKLWFFKDLTDEQRLRLFALHDYPVKGMESLSLQSMVLDHLLGKGVNGDVPD